MNPCGSPSTLPLLGLLLESKLRSRSCFYSGRQLLRAYAERQFNAFLWISLIGVTLLLLRRVARLFRLWSEGSKLPGPPCPSFYGHCNLFSRENFSDVLSGFHERYGSIFKLWLGPTQLLVSVKDPEVVKEILLKAEDKLPLTGRAFHLAFGPSSLFRSSYDEVQKRRESLSVELNTSLLKSINVIPVTVLDSINNKITVAMAKGSANSEQISRHIAFTILGATLFGETFLTWSKASIYEKLLMSVAKDACFWASYNVTPFWRRGFWEYHSSCSKLRCLTQEIVQLCSKNRVRCCNQRSSANPKDKGLEAAYDGLACSSAMMSSSFFPDEICSILCSSEELSANIMGVMFHGYLTTAGLICNVLVRIVKHPEIQDQIYSEIVMAKKGLLKDKQNVDDMILLTATVYESARLLPAWPLLQRCSLENDLHLKCGAIIPAGAVLVVPVQLVQMDGSSWGKDATEFNPYRFLSIAQGRSVSAYHTGEAKHDHLSERSFVLNDPNENAAFLPFGSGARACVGQKFVIYGVVSLLASLLEHYEIRLKPGSETDLKLSTNNSILQLHPSPELVFIKRSD
ncbi:cytochrome P450 4F11-like isoform X1 [Punica granatum]|uniref:Cytochrome P450 4F11-like isoform X1 n=1 Tax=Punica granatum TaxID=22663 RepID=A0A6P8BNL7_PUNGR|nr:cytochrome P450 4F11-like isoform X1 [Punica granatum]